MARRQQSKRGKMIPVMVYYPKQIVDIIDVLVRNGFYSSRAQCVREGTKEVLLEQFARIDEMVRREVK